MEQFQFHQSTSQQNYVPAPPPSDERFRRRLEKIYTAWRESLAAAFARGIKAGNVREGISPRTVAAFVVAALAGIIGTAKNAQTAWVVRKYGLRLMPELYEHLNPMPFEAAVQMELELAEDLRAAGYTVTGGH